MEEKGAKFEVRFGMPGAFGCIDGTHVPITRPSENSQDFFNYKQFHSLSVQAVCDYRGLFMDVDWHHGHSQAIGKVFYNSKINKDLQQGKLPTNPKSLHRNLATITNYILGDPAYPSPKIGEKLD